MLRYILLLFCLISLSNVQAQDIRRPEFQKLLQEQVPGKVSTSTSSSAPSDSLSLVYLGQVRCADGMIVQIVSSAWFWGPGRRATARIILFNKADIYLGDFKLTSVSDLPYKLENGQLSFKERAGTRSRECRISFEKTIPSSIFLSFDGTNGDLYQFSRNLE